MTLRIGEGTAVRKAFERLGQMRQLFTELQTLAADLEDDHLSQHVARGMAINTIAIRRANDLLQIQKPTGPHDPDLAVTESWGPEGDEQ